MTEVIDWLTLIAPALPIIGIGIIFLVQSFKWWNTKQFFSRAVLMYGTFIIAVALIFFATNAEINRRQDYK